MYFRLLIVTHTTHWHFICIFYGYFKSLKKVFFTLSSIFTITALSEYSNKSANEDIGIKIVEELLVSHRNVAKVSNDVTNKLSENLKEMFNHHNPDDSKHILDGKFESHIGNTDTNVAAGKK